QVADEFDVSIGTVSNVIDEARRGEIEGVEPLDEQLDALIDLGKRLDEASLDVTTANIGLDMYSWIVELGLEPADIEQLKADLERVTGEDRDLNRAGPALQRLLSLEEETGLSVEDRLGELLELLADREPETVQRLADLAREAEGLPGGVDQLESAIEQSIEIQELGFDLDTAHRLATELGSNSDGDQQEAIDTLVDIYAEYEQLSEAVDDLRDSKESLEGDCETLRESRRNLEEHQEQLQESIQRAERALDSLEETQEELRATNEDLRDDVAHQRERLESIESDLEAKRSELEAIQEEREVVHAYRRFLRDADLSDQLLLDLDDLLRYRDGEADDPLEELASDAEQRTIEELRDLAMEMLEGEEMMPVAEHERKMREKGRTEQTLEELQEEREAVASFLEFLESGEIPEDLLEELLAIERGYSHPLESTKERKTEEARQYLVGRLHEFTEGETAIAASRHSEMLLEERERFEAELTSAFETIDRLAGQIHELQRLLDEDWVAKVSDQIIDGLDADEDRLTVDDLQEVIKETLEEEIQRRVKHESEQQNANNPENPLGTGVVMTDRSSLDSKPEDQ
ncbi:MAG: hypothetical protein ABEH59_07445, partial [Halobacteriales archaeon]